MNLLHALVFDNRKDHVVTFVARVALNVKSQLHYSSVCTVIYFYFLLKTIYYM